MSMMYEDVVQLMNRLEQLEANMAAVQRRYEKQIQAYRELQEGERRVLEDERKDLAGQLERWMRAYAEMGNGRRFRCPAGELRLTPARKWQFGLSLKATAEHLLEMGHLHAVKVSLKKSVLETLSPLILAELKITRPARVSFTYRLGGKR